MTVWFTVGGVSDLRYLFGQLRGRAVDVLDDGRVAEVSSGAKGDLV